MVYYSFHRLGAIMIALLSMAYVHQGYAQVYGNPGASFANQQLRGLLDSIDAPLPSPRLFYDHSAHFVEKSWWEPHCPDTSSASIFSVLYDETFTSHYDTTQFLRVDTVVSRGLRFGADTSVISLIFYKYVTLKDSALFDSTWFYVDTTGPKLYDNPNAQSSPYIHDTMFAVCAMRDILNTGTVTYRIDPDFIFTDPELGVGTDTDRQLQIDFADGTGWHPFAGNYAEHYVATYDTIGEKVIQARVINTTIYDVEGSGNTRVVTPAALITDPADTVWSHLPGMTVGVYGPCGMSEGELPPKFIIMLEGFDFTETSTQQDLYNKFVQNSGLQYLRNYGYTFLTVDWRSSKSDMTVNALNLVSLIDFLKCNFLDTNLQDDPQHQFVIMGSSMGGVIARYALTWMEANPNFSNCFPDNHHNTRLFVSMDAPHQGAHVPIAFQTLYENYTMLNDILPFNVATQMLHSQNILNSVAARQLIALHVNSSSGSPSNITQDVLRTQFINDLIALNPQTGGYPEHVKMIAISNGLLTGEHQTGINNSCVMAAGDVFLRAEGSLHMNVLGFPVIGASTNLILRSHTNGGSFFDFGIERNNWGIQLQWFTIQSCLPPFNWPCFSISIPMGVTFGLVSSQVTTHTKSATGLPLYDAMPGGRLSFDGTLEDALDNWTVGLVWNDPTNLALTWSAVGASAAGCGLTPVDNSSAVGRRVGLDLDLSTQGLNFNFVPIQSALDYNNGVPLDHDIYNEDIAIKMASTPFDVIVGEVNGLPGYPQPQSHSELVHNDNGRRWLFPTYNLEHVSLRNHQLPQDIMHNWLIDPAYDPMADPDTLPEWIWALYLNREIGDESMYVDNLALDRPAQFQSEYALAAGRNKNPYYEYPSQGVQQHHVFTNYSDDPIFNPFGYNLFNNGIFAKDAPLSVEANGNAVLISDTLVDTVGTAINGGGVTIQLMPLFVCTLETFDPVNKAESPPPVPWAAAEEPSLVLYPNPVQAGGQLFLKGLSQGSYEINLWGSEGSHLMSEQIQVEDAQVLRLSTSQSMPPGIYILNIHAVHMRRNIKFVIQ